MTIGAGFPSGGPTATVTGFSVAPGLTPVSDDLATNPFTSFDGDVQAITVTGDRPGSYPATVTWTQYDPAADSTCSGSASTTFSLSAPSPPHLTKPRATGGLPDESTVRLKFPKGADERPLVVRYRAVAKRRFPGRGARAHTFTVPLLGIRTPAGRRSAARSASAGSRSRSAPSARSTARSRSARSSSSTSARARAARPSATRSRSSRAAGA